MNYDRYNQGGDSFSQFGFPGVQQPNYFDPPPFGPPQTERPPTGSPPRGPAPGFSPPIPAWQIGSGGISSCLFTNTYIWSRNGNSFWFFPTHVGRQFITGYRWRRRHGWIFQVVHRNEVISYQCFR